MLATSDADFIVADVEHDIYDFPMLHRFLLEVQDFHHRFRTEPRPAPAVLIKLGHRGGWDPRYEILQTGGLRPRSFSGAATAVSPTRSQVPRLLGSGRAPDSSLQAGSRSRDEGVSRRPGTLHGGSRPSGWRSRPLLQ